jgi:hypothetical protein
MQQPAVLNPESIRAAVVELLGAAKLEGDFDLQPLPGGGNNRVFRVEVNGTRALLKAYFRHPEDRRDRLGAEYSFCAFAWQNGLRSLPQPLARDPINSLGLYEFIEGRPVRPEEIDDGAMGQALSFFSEVNRHRYLPVAQDLPIASEAYFRLSDHLHCIERRLEILRRIDLASAIDREAEDFVGQHLTPAWEQVRCWVHERARSFGLSLEAEIARQEWCLSPSDFGFHNAIRTDGDPLTLPSPPSEGGEGRVRGGRLRFIDFEYSGWDDPAKMMGDFFCQVAMPISTGYFDGVLERVVSGLAAPRGLRARVALLMPVYRVKWCCIVLNEFVRVSSNRRRFAHADGTGEEKKIAQLQKARQILQSVTDGRNLYGLH